MIIPPDVEQALNHMEPQHREAVMSIITMQKSVIARTPEGEIARKITPDHITKMLENEAKSMDYQHDDVKREKRTNLLYVVIAVVAVLAIIVLLRDNNPELMSDIIKLLTSFILGGFGGYGLAKKNSD